MRVKFEESISGWAPSPTRTVAVSSRRGIATAADTAADATFAAYVKAQKDAARVKAQEEAAIMKAQQDAAKPRSLAGSILKLIIPHPQPQPQVASERIAEKA